MWRDRREAVSLLFAKPRSCGRSSTAEPLVSTQKMRVRFPLPAPIPRSCCLRLAAQDPRPSSGQRGFKSRRQRHSSALQPFPLRPTAGCRTLNAAIVVRIHEGEPLSVRRLPPEHCTPGRRSSAVRAALSYGEGRLFKSTRRHQCGGSVPAVVQRRERLNVARETAVRFRPQGPARSGRSRVGSAACARENR
jgi:hypothetical protein